jgi:hypothetical protein
VGISAAAEFAKSKPKMVVIGRAAGWVQRWCAGLGQSFRRHSGHFPKGFGNLGEQISEKNDEWGMK